MRASGIMGLWRKTMRYLGIVAGFAVSLFAVSTPAAAQAPGRAVRDRVEDVRDRREDRRDHRLPPRPIR
jgi:hypothetical protein